MNVTPRHPMPVQPADVRVGNFDEVALGYTPALAAAEAERCLNCKNAPCMAGCPVGVRIPDFISCVKRGDIAAASSILCADNEFAAVCGRVCPQESQCEKCCVRREKLGGAVAIGALERYVADHTLLSGEYRPADVAPANGLRVAVIGSGPASLTCAAELARAGTEVTVYEALHKAGGVLMYGIPQFRLPKDVVERQLERVRALGVKIVTNVVIGKTLLIEELLDSYDAAFIGTGAGLPSFLGVVGENLAGVYSANEYLTRVNLMGAGRTDSVTPLLMGKRVAVVGAGNVAMDSARTARRLGAEVTLVYRRSRAEMPAREEEIVHAEEEGVRFMLLTNPVRILGSERVSGMRCVRMELGETDASGRRRPMPVAGSEFDIECDGVIVALGTTPNPLIKNSMPQLATTAKGTIVADECGRTNIARLYAGGDAMTGAATVILAMGAGKRAARAMLADLAVNVNKTRG